MHILSFSASPGSMTLEQPALEQLTLGQLALEHLALEHLALEHLLCCKKQSGNKVK